MRRASSSSSRVRYFLLAYAAATALFYAAVLVVSPPGTLPRWAGSARRGATITSKLSDETLSAQESTPKMQMPAILYGTAWKKDRTAQLVQRAVKMGFRGIDTACQPKHYAEDQVGVALKALEAEGIPREKLFIQTKFTSLAGQDPNKIPYDRDAPLHLQVAQSFAASQANLQTDYVDSLVLHSPLDTLENTLVVWRAMEDLHRRGLALRLGLSNTYDVATLQWVHERAEVKPAVLQNRFVAQHGGHDRQIRAFCHAHAIQYQSFWTLTGNRDVLQHSVVRELARAKGKTPQQIFFRFAMQEGIVPLTGTTSDAHMREDLEVEHGLVLDDSQMTQMRAATYQSA